MDTLERELLLSARKGDLTQLQALLDGKTSDQITSLLNRPISNNRNLLFVACLSELSNLPFIQYLVDQGSDVNFLTPSNISSLGAACSNSAPNLEIIEYLLEHTTRKTTLDYKGNNLLHYAVDNTEFSQEATQLLLKHQINPNQINHYGMSPIFRAALRNRFELVKLMHQYGGDLRAHNNNHNTVLMYACMNNNREAVEWLLEQDVDVEECDNQGDTAIMYLCGCDNHCNELDLGLIQLLHQAGASLTHITSDGYTALMYAACCQGENRVKFKPDYHILKYLLDNGVDPTLTSDKGSNFLDYLLINDENDMTVLQLLKDEYIELTSEYVITSILKGNSPILRNMVLKMANFPMKTPENTSCGICQSEFKSGNVFVECQYSHAYHEFCIMHWFQKSGNNNCPFCRLPIDILKSLAHYRVKMVDTYTQYEDPTN